MVKVVVFSTTAAYSGPERRRHVRHAVVSTFWLLTEGGDSLLMESVNVSAGGAYLRLDQRHRDVPAPGATVRFTVTAHDTGIVPDDANAAMVVRTGPDGIAIRFTGA